ncbi:MAG: hypothetical protein DME87_14275 [Verrucomicrobia bacterium]|nr:MAG: hypothetical protein DME87_14275 [Verrucomicrobiota bacterium]
MTDSSSNSGEDYVRDQLTEDISVETLAELADLSPFHFSRVFKQTTGMSPLQFVTRERIARAQQLIRSGSCRSAQPHRDRARSRLHEPEPFWSSLPANGWRHADRVSQRLVSHRPSGSDFSARTRHVAHDHESSVARMYDGAIAPEWFGCTTTPHKNKPIGASKHMHQSTYNAKAYSAASPTSGLASTKIQRREPTDRDVQIEILFCGICHSDLHSVRNEWSEFMATNYPIVPGHEIIGRVTKVGSAVTKYKPGDLAAVGCMVDSDGTCPQCKAGLEQFCPNMILTFNSPDKHLGGVTYGGYSEGIVVDEHFVLRIPSNLNLAAAAPLLCAGITTYSPMHHWGVTKGKKVGVVGLGGLGHMAVKFAHALGAHVVVFTTSPNKKEDAVRLGADEVVVSRNADEMKKHAGSFDFILDAVSANHDINAYINLLGVDGNLTLVGAPAEPLAVPAFSLIGRRRSFSGSMIGGIAETQEMLDFCGENNITADVEVIPIQKANEAYERLLKSDVKYRFSIDMASLKSE